MITILLSWLILALAVYLTAMILPGFQVPSFGGAAWVALWLGIVEWLIGWLLFGLIGLATLGLGFLLAFLTRWLVTAILLKLVDAMSTNLRIRSFGTAFLGAMLMSGIGTLGEMLLRSLHL
jgi:putative membrane protein